MDKKKKIIAGGAVAALLAASAVYATKSKRSSGSKKDGSDKSVAGVALKQAEKNLIPKAEASTPLEALAFLDSFSPSLMARGSMFQGITTAASVLSARGLSAVIEKTVDALAPKKDSHLSKRIFTRLSMLAGGFAMGKYPKSDDESIAVASIRSTGRLLEVASLGGVVMDVLTRDDNTEVGEDGSSKANRSNNKNLIIIGSLITAGAAYRARSMLEQRRSVINTIPQDPDNKLLPSIGYGIAFVTLARAIGAAMGTSKELIGNWFGEGPLKKETANTVNAGLWAGIAVGAYWAVITKIGQKESKIEANYSVAPKNKLVSGSPNSAVKFEHLGVQGRRYVTDVLKKEHIKDVMKETKVKDPIRLYVGYDDDPLYVSGRAELALKELDRTNAYSRKYLLLVSPTGTGWIDHTMIESAEYLARGDIATCTIQYGKFPSFLALQKVSLGRAQFRLLLWGVKLQIEKLPKNKRPKVLIFGESLGAWSSSDTIMHMGTEGFDYYGIDKALWAGMPKLAKWARVEKELQKTGDSTGETGVFDNIDQINKLSKDQRKKLRAVLLNHDNDPITHIHPNLIVRRPGWLEEDVAERGRGVPKDQEYIPVITFWQTAVDAANAMRVVPGKFRSHGHDYRADMAQFVAAAYDMPATKAQMNRIEKNLEEIEIIRAEKTKQVKDRQ